MNGSDRRALVIGVGTAYAGDDAAGRLVADRLAAERPAPPCDIRQSAGIAADLVALFDGRDAVIIADACQSGGPVGQVRVIDAARDSLPAELDRSSSHGLGVAEAVGLARALNLLPRRCLILAIEGREFGLGAPLSGPVDAAIDRCVRDIAEMLRQPVSPAAGPR